MRLFFFVDKENDIWIYSPSGLWIYNPAEKKWQKKLRDLINRQSRSAVLSVAQDLQGRIWIGREHDGVNILNKSTGEIKTLMHHLTMNAVCKIILFLHYMKILME